MFFSKRSASFTRSLPRFSGVSFLQAPLKAFRAAETARSTSFSVASWTEQMTDSSLGLITSNVFPSTPLTHSLLMKLSHLSAIGQWMTAKAAAPQRGGKRGKGGGHISGRAGGHLQAGGLLVIARVRRLELDRETRHVENETVNGIDGYQGRGGGGEGEEEGMFFVRSEGQAPLSSAGDDSIEKGEMRPSSPNAPKGYPPAVSASRSPVVRPVCSLSRRSSRASSGADATEESFCPALPASGVATPPPQNVSRPRKPPLSCIKLGAHALDFK